MDNSAASNSDRLSNLPWDVLDNILCRLPIEEAVRTSILSKKWRHKWRYLSDLRFHDDYSMYWDAFAKLVYHILLCHRRSINRFMLTNKFNLDADDLDHWILFLSRNDVKEIILDLRAYYELPPCLFSCQNLRNLNVSGGQLVENNGFRNLVSLQLKRFETDVTMLENLISGCPLLEKLMLSEFSIWNCLTINAPKLTTFYLDGEFEDIILENSPNLQDVSFKLTFEEYSNRHEDAGMPKNLIAWLACPSQLERLSVSGHILKFWTGRHQQSDIPIACENRKVLELSDINLGQSEQIFGILFLLRSSSNLKDLTISVQGPFTEEAYSIIKKACNVIQGNPKNCFNQLRVLKIKISELGLSYMNFEQWRSDLEFVRLMLVSSPKLENILVEFNPRQSSELWLMKKMLSFERASTDLSFNYSFPGDEKFRRFLY